MAETPQGYFPKDIRVRWANPPTMGAQHATEMMVSVAGARQRRALYPASGYRHYRGSTQPLDPVTREYVDGFLNARRGMYAAFYHFENQRRMRTLFACGSITSKTYTILPFADATVYDIGIGSPRVTVATTGTYPLSPRPRRYAGLFFPAAGSVSVGNDASLHLTGDMTLCAWVWVLAAVNPPVMSNEVNAVSGFSFGVFPSTAKIYAAWNSAGLQVLKQSTTAIPLQSWHHIAVTRSGANCAFYLDGVAAGTGSGITSPAAATNALLIGAFPGGTSPFNGMIQSARIFNASLSAGQIQQIYNDTLYANTNAVGHWPMNEGYGTNVADISGLTTNAGTISGGPVWVGGETLVTFGSAQTGAVTATVLGRERVAVINESDTIGNGWLRASGLPKALYDLSFVEVS
jgi:hypothetical protein